MTTPPDELPPEELPPLQVQIRMAPEATCTAYVIYNPTAGSGLGKKHVEIEVLQQRFLDNHWNVAMVQTRCAGDGTFAAQYAVEEGADVVVVMGGDGTVNEVVQALAGGTVPLGIIPFGTINVLASELGLPKDPLEAVDTLARMKTRPIDLGKANGRYFTMMIGLGYDAESTLAIVPSLKQWTGPIAYWAAGLQSFITHKAVRARITVSDGKKTRRVRRLIYMMVVSNTGLYAGGILKFTPEADIADGFFDVCIIKSRRWYRAVLHILLSLLGGLRSVQDVEFWRCKTIKIRTGRPFPYQLDGDPAGSTPVTIEMVPNGVMVIAGEGGAGTVPAIEPKE